MLEADHGLGVAPNNPFLKSTSQPWGRVPNQFSVDPGTATVTFQNMENFSLDLRPVPPPGRSLSPDDARISSVWTRAESRHDYPLGLCDAAGELDGGDSDSSTSDAAWATGGSGSRSTLTSKF